MTHDSLTIGASFAVVVLLVTSVATAAIGPAAVFSHSSDMSASESITLDSCSLQDATNNTLPATQPQTSITVERINRSTAHVTIAYNTTEQTHGLLVNPHSQYERVVSTTELNTTGNAYRWTHNNTASITLAVNATKPQFDSNDQTYGDTWMFVSTPKVTHSWVNASGTQHCSHAFETNATSTVTRSDNGTVAASGRKLLLAANMTQRTQTLASGETVTLFVPGASLAEFTEPGDDHFSTVLDSLNSASKNYHDPRTGSNSHHVFVLPESFGPAGMYYGGAIQSETYWVTDHQSANGTRNTYVHEYIHSQHSYSLSKNMYWFKEASAKYYETRHGVNTTPRLNVEGKVDWWNESKYPDSVMSKPDTWQGTWIDYYKGGRILIHLDQRLRTHSNTTVFDLILWMNRHDGTVTYSDFRGYVVDHTNASTGIWLDKHVMTGAELDITMSDFERFRNNSTDHNHQLHRRE